MPELKMRMISQGVTPEIHAHLIATNHSYALIKKNAESLTAEPTNTISPSVHSNGMKSVSASTHKLRGASPVLVFPTWTHIAQEIHPLL
jgi:hypothetical protein